MKSVAPVRAAMGVRTVFNILGPLANPAQPPLHVIGAYSRDVATLMGSELGWSLDRIHAEEDQYAAQIRHHLAAEGLALH